MPEKKETLGPLIAIEDRNRGPVNRKIRRVAMMSLERLLAMHTIRACYDAIPACEDAYSFAEKALETLNIDFFVRDRDLAAIPQSGPCIVVSNHPFGGIDGLILAAVLSRVRGDVRILANYFLGGIPEMQSILFLVDPFGRESSARKNIAALKRTVQWVKQGGMLLTFPSGEVSHFSLKRRRIEDPQWSETIGRLVRLTGAPVLPAYLDGGNSALFHLAGLLHPRLRTALLPRELLKKRSSEVHLRIGNVIPSKRLSSFKEISDLMDYLRFRTYLLGKGFRRNRKILKAPQWCRERSRPQLPIVPPGDRSILALEVEALPAHQKLTGGGQLSVYYANAHQIPEILREIGRLREETFRGTGEGTGNAIDLDPFDRTYVHLFLWNDQEREIAGAYRLGPTDEILPLSGKKGLYTDTLFNYRGSLLTGMGPALEMGRTFVRDTYQRSYSALLLLWKGIGHFVAQNPRYRILFGAVSITSDYQAYSRQLMVAFLKMNHDLPHLSKMVKPRKPFKRGVKACQSDTTRAWWEDLDEVSSWISGIEADGKGVPILLKQYLKLGGKIVSFNVDKGFCNALDGLIVVDLTLTDSRTLKRYMGEDGLLRFYEYHGVKEDSRSPHAFAAVRAVAGS